MGGNQAAVVLDKSRSLSRYQWVPELTVKHSITMDSSCTLASMSAVHLLSKLTFVQG